MNHLLPQADQNIQSRSSCLWFKFDKLVCKIIAGGNQAYTAAAASMV